MGTENSTKQVPQPEKNRVRTLRQTRCCPHCGTRITLTDILSMARGDGVIGAVAIRLPNGKIAVIRETEFNPQTMMLANENQ